MKATSWMARKIFYYLGLCIGTDVRRYIRRSDIYYTSIIRADIIADRFFLVYVFFTEEEGLHSRRIWNIHLVPMSYITHNVMEQHK